jgi:acetyl-CoA C-acetyltransferase
MNERVAIIGIGISAARPSTPDLSFKELMFETAQKAYADAEIDSRDVGSFVTCAEDLTEGISIFDEYTPDQLGAVQKPMHTVTQDGLHGIADAVMQLRSGIAGLAVVEAHSKHSNLENPSVIAEYALDPVYNRPLGFNPHAIAGLEMNRFLAKTGLTQSHCAQVVVKNRAHALKNIAAAYPAKIFPENAEASSYIAYPLREAETARGADGCVVVVLATESAAKRTARRPIWVRGVGFANDSPTLETRDWVDAQYARCAATMAYRQARINDPGSDIDCFEIDDTYAYKELQHLIALGLYAEGAAAGRAVESGETSCAGKTPVNVSGGSLGIGHTLEASGLYRLSELVLQLRGEAGPRQLDRARIGLAQSWRGIPTTSGAVVILGKE